MRTRVRVWVAALGLLSWPLGGTRSMAEDAPAGVPAEDRERVEAEAMGQASEADRLFKAGDYAAALPLYEAERGSRAALGDRRYEAYALRAMGCCHAGLGDDDAAVAAWHAARKLDALRDDSGFVGYDWLLIAQAHLRRARPGEAVTALGQALPRLSKAVDRDHEADARLALADALLRLDRPGEAVEHLDRAEALAGELNDPRRLATAWLASSLAARSTDEPGLAAERADDARRAFEALGAKAGSALASRALGEALADLDLLGPAAARLEDAARTHEGLDDAPELATDLALLAAVHADAGDLAAAARVARRVVSVRHDADDPGGEADALVALANYQNQAGDRPAAAASVAAAVEIARRDAVPARLVPLLVLSARIARHDGRHADADALFDEAGRSALLGDDASLRRMVADARALDAKPAP